MTPRGMVAERGGEYLQELRRDPFLVVFAVGMPERSVRVRLNVRPVDRVPAREGALGGRVVLDVAEVERIGRVLRKQMLKV